MLDSVSSVVTSAGELAKTSEVFKASNTAPTAQPASLVWDSTMFWSRSLPMPSVR